nr:uncharacterized protein I206_07634 [Kwoniella pini CBS 10737]OCF46400.1 hypothetical protein I206_07634 [Kwoniella pini CBS 10737]
MTASSSSTAEKDIYIFTTSQIPLPIKYSHPRKPNLVIPPILHRTLHNALDGESPSILFKNSELIIPHPDELIKHDLPCTSFSNSNSFENKLNENELLDSSFSNQILDSELTIKLHLIGNPSTSSSSSLSSKDVDDDDNDNDEKVVVEEYLNWIKKSLEILEKYKGFKKEKIDNFLIGFKGIDYRGSKTIASEMFGCGSEGLENPNTQIISNKLEKIVLNVFNKINYFFENENKNENNTKLGSLYFTLNLLKKLKSQIKINSLDTPDCHHLPKEYTNFAKENKIQLWAGGGGEGSDPLPSIHLHNLLQEFSIKLNDLTNGEFNNSSLENLINLREDGLKFQENVEKAVQVKWVLSYTLVSKTRNVVKDKG